MDEIEDFFNISKDFKRVSAPAPVPKPKLEPVASTSRKLKREPDAESRYKVKQPKVC